MSTKRLKIGVIGCGAIAQSQHLPNLAERPDIWEVAAVCDVSPGLVEAVGKRFQVPRRYTDYQALLQSDVDAVLLCLADPKTPAALAAARAGKHMLIEKPMCWTVAEAEQIIAAGREAGVVVMAAYMKQHEPGFQYAREKIQAMTDVRFIEVNHLHPNNALHMRDFFIERFDDVPAAESQALETLRDQTRAAAIGADATPAERYAFGMLIGSMIHDISCLRGLFGPPERVVSAEIWHEGRGFSTVLAYPDERRCVMSWVDLPNLWDFQETLEVYGADERVIISFATGFSRGQPTTVTVQGTEAGAPFRKELVMSHDPGFKREIEQFHASILGDQQPLTLPEGARDDAALVAEIMAVARRQRAVERQ